MSHVQEMIDKMRNATKTAKTARERVKTAGAEDLSERGDLLANTIHKITAQEEERVFPEEVRLRKEAAEKAKLAETTSAKTAEADEKPDAEPPAEPATTQEKNEEPAETKQANDLTITDVNAFFSNPLVKQGFDEVMTEHNEEFRRYAGAIITKAGSL